MADRSPASAVAGAVMATLGCRMEQNPDLPRLSRCAVHLGSWTIDGCGTVLSIATAAAPIAAAAELEVVIADLGQRRSECGGYADQAEFGSHHYPDPKWSHCDGCSAASSADADNAALIATLRERVQQLRAGYVRGCACQAGDAEGGWHERRGEQCVADELEVWRRLPSAAQVAADLTGS